MDRIKNDYICVNKVIMVSRLEWFLAQNFIPWNPYFLLFISLWLADINYNYKMAAVWTDKWYGNTAQVGTCKQMIWAELWRDWLREIIKLNKNEKDTLKRVKAHPMPSNVIPSSCESV